MQNEIFLIKISGEDKPGLTSAITSILAENNINILDMGQAVIHNTLSLGILAEFPAEDKSNHSVLKDLLFKAYTLQIHIDFEIITPESYSQWVSLQGKDRYIITLLAEKITARQIAQITKVIYEQELNIDLITRLSGRVPLSDAGNHQHTRSCIELSVRGKPSDIQQVTAGFLEISQNYGLDIAFQKDDIFRRNRRLVCFDMDSTLIQTEVIVELARKHGVGDKVHEITESAMRGEIDFKESFRRRVALLEGLSESVMQDIADNLPITDGADRLIAQLKALGYKIAIISGGFTYFGMALRKRFGLDYVFANELEIKDGKLTGKHLGEIIDGERKAFLLKELAKKENIQLEQVIAVGDGANDLPMLKLAGLGIAFHAKPIVKKSASHSISTVGLDGILYLLGLRDRDVNF